MVAPLKPMIPGDLSWHFGSRIIAPLSFFTVHRAMQKPQKKCITPFEPYTITAIILHNPAVLSHVSLQQERWELNEYRSFSIGLFVLLWLLCVYQSTRWILRSDTRLQNIKHQKSHEKQYDSASGYETDQFSWTNQATDLCYHFPFYLLEYLLYSKSGLLIINQTNNCRIRKCTNNQTWGPINKEVSCYKLQIPDYIHIQIKYKMLV